MIINKFINKEKHIIHIISYKELEKQLNVMLVHYQFHIERMKNFQLFLIYLIEMIVVAHHHMEEHFPQHWTHIFAIDMR